MRARHRTQENHLHCPPLPGAIVHLPITYLSLTAVGNGRGVLVLDGARVAAAGLDGLDDTLRLDVIVRHLAEDDVLAVEP